MLVYTTPPLPYDVEVIGPVGGRVVCTLLAGKHRFLCAAVRRGTQRAFAQCVRRQFRAQPGARAAARWQPAPGGRHVGHGLSLCRRPSHPRQVSSGAHPAPGNSACWSHSPSAPPTRSPTRQSITMLRTLLQSCCRWWRSCRSRRRRDLPVLATSRRSLPRHSRWPNQPRRSIHLAVSVVDTVAASPTIRSQSFSGRR